MFDMEAKFVPAGDSRLNLPQTNRHQIAYKVADPEVKHLAQTTEMIDAFTWLVLDSYKPHAVAVPESMQDATNDFRTNDGDNEVDNFHSLFKFTNSRDDCVPVCQVKAEVCRNKIAMTPQRYNKLLRARSCTQATVNNKRVWQRLISGPC